MQNKSDSTNNSDFYKPSKTSFSLEKLLDDFSFWFPRARDYGFTADELYITDENAMAVAVPIPIVEEGDYKLWLFTFSRMERITPRLRDLWLSDISELSGLQKLSYLIHRETHFILADIVRSRITPKPGRKSVYVVKAEYAFKVYEIIAKAIKGFVDSFRENLRYGEDLLALCDDLERFSEKLKRRADELKSKTAAQPSPTRYPSDTGKPDAELRKEAEEYLALLEKSRVI